MKVPFLMAKKIDKIKRVTLDSGRQRIFHGLKVILSHKGLLIGTILVSITFLSAILAPFIALHDPYLQDIVQRRIPPIWHSWFWDKPQASWNHPLGTDRLGRDYLSRIIYGSQISLLVAFSTALLSGLIGSTLGILGGYFRGKLDMVINFIITTRLSMPVILFALAAASFYGSSLKLIIIVLGLLLWDRFAVVMRSATMQERNAEYVKAARAAGCSTTRIILGEILPNLLNPFFVVATLEMATAILYEAALSFLGLGVQSPLASWGLMLSEGKEDMFFDPWMITIPGLALFQLVLAINLIGDGLRDVTAPDRNI
jgi:peptide/nickel transport system permease protein